MQSTKQQFLKQLDAYLARQGSNKVVFVNPSIAKNAEHANEIVIGTSRFFYGDLEALRGDLKKVGIGYTEDVSDGTCALYVPLDQPDMEAKVEKFTAALAAVPPVRAH